MEARRSNLPTAICSGSLVSRDGKPVGEGVRAGWKYPWKGQSAPETADHGAPSYLRTNERSEQGREPKRTCVQTGKPEGRAAAVRVVAVLIWEAAAGLG